MLPIRRAVLYVLVLFCLVVSSCSKKDSKTEDISKSTLSVLHILAPSQKDAAQYDPLVAETALRLAASELANRYGVDVRYWSADQLADVPADAYPRLELKNYSSSLGDFSGNGVLCLKRQGDTFSVFMRDKKGDSIAIGRRVLALPQKVYVGLMANAFYEPQDVSTRFSGVKLNGAEFKDPTLSDIGSVVKPSTVGEEQGRWTLTSFGYEARDRNDFRECGPFLYLPCEGDFELEASLNYTQMPDPMAGMWIYSGLMCRSTLDSDAVEIGIFKKNGKVQGGWRDSSYPRLNWFTNATEHEMSPVIQEQAGQRFSPSVRRATVKISWATWSDLTASIQRLADGVVAEVGSRYQLKAVQASPTTRPAISDETLDTIRRQILSGESGKILAASRQIDQLMADHSPTSSGHYLAAMPGAILASQEFYGFFCDQPRFLATPMTHLMLAQRAGQSDRSEDRLTEAWMALVCGYPGAAKSLIDSLPAEVRDSSEARALTMFITRDYTPYTSETIMTASTPEQMAWTYAAFCCDRDDLLVFAPARMASSKLLASVLPVYGVGDVGTGHECTTLGLRYALARDFQTFLMLPEIPQADRKAAADQLAGLFNIPEGMTLSNQVGQIGLGLASGRMDSLEMGENLSPILSALNDLYIAALARKGEPTIVKNGKTWSAMSLHDFTDFRRGFVANLVCLRTNFMARLWCVPDQTYEFCRQASQGFAKNSDFQDFFNVYGLLVRRTQDAYAKLDELGRTPFGQNPAFYFHLAASYKRGYVPHDIFGKIGSRGFWQWSTLFQTMDEDVMPFENEQTIYLADLASSANPYLVSTARYFFDRAEKLAPMKEMLERMPYNFGLLSYAAQRARALKLDSEAITYYQKMIELAPEHETGYYDLMHLYAKEGKRVQAIELAQKAADRCQDTVGLSNMLGQAACWMVEENRPAEALEMGRRSAQSYSSWGLNGLAVALEANDRQEEALTIYRAIAERYESSASYLINYLLRDGASDEEIKSEVKELLEMHATMKLAVANSIAEGFRTGGDHLALLESLFKDDLTIVKPQTQAYELLLSSLYSRHFDKTLEYAAALAKHRRLEASELIMVHVALLLSGHTAEVAEYQKTLSGYPKGQWLYDHIQYILGGCTAEQLLDRCGSNELNRAYAFWLIGVQAEGKKDYSAALAAYEKASRCCTTYLPRRLGQYWPEMLNPQTTQPVQKE